MIYAYSIHLCVCEISRTYRSAAPRNRNIGRHWRGGLFTDKSRGINDVIEAKRWPLRRRLRRR